MAFILALTCQASDVKDFSIKEVEKLGRLIYEQDIAAAIGTDVLFAQGLDLSQHPLRGWVVETKKKESIITFVGEYDTGPAGAFEIHLDPKGKKKPTFRELERSKLNKRQLAFYKARTLVSDKITEPCSDRYNIVVLDNVAGEGLLVYALAATTDPDAVLVGGHYRFTVSADGTKVLASKKLSASCLTLDKTPEDMPEGASLAALTMTHIVSKRPLEIHVFLNYLHRMDFFIATEEMSIWKIENGRVSKVS